MMKAIEMPSLLGVWRRRPPNASYSLQYSVAPPHLTFRDAGVAPQM